MKNRFNFLSVNNLLIVMSLVAVFGSTSVFSQPVKMLEFPVPPRAPGQTDVLQLACEKLDTVRIAFIGLGMRGKDAVERYMNIEGVKVTALCDVDFWKVDECQKILQKNGRPAAATYKNAADWKEVCTLQY